MKAIIIATGEQTGDDADLHCYPKAMLTLLDRPFLQHVVEFIVARGITRLDFVLSNMPEKVESWFGNGQRWGATIDYHLARNADQPYQLVKAIVSNADDDPVLLVHGDRLPLDAAIENHPNRGDDMPITYVWGEEAEPESGDSHGWTGWSWIAAAVVRDVPDDAGIADLESLCIRKSKSEGRLVEVRRPLSAQTYSQLLDSQKRALSDHASGLLVSGREVEPGIWISRNVGLPSSVELIPPVYLGAGSRIGQGSKLGGNVVIGEGSVMDRHCIARDSLIMPGIYVGESLELLDLVVDKNHVVNTRLGANCHVRENFLVGSMEVGPIHDWIAGAISRIAALGLLVGGTPIMMLTAGYLKLFRSGPVLFHKEYVRLPASPDRISWPVCQRWSFRSDADGQRRSGIISMLLLEFLPALFDIAKGDLHFVGVAPRTVEQLSQLPVDWRELVLRSKAGIVTEASVRFGHAPSDDELYCAEAFYAVNAGIRYDLKLLIGWMWRSAFGKDKVDEAMTVATPDTLAATLETNSDFGSLDRIRKYIKMVCHEMVRPPLDEDETYKVAVAVQETATNIMRHAYHGSPDGMIRFEADVDEQQLTVRITHWGEAFGSGNIPEPSFDKPQTGGYGLYIISQYIDDVSYCCDENGGKCVSLKKYLRGGQSSGSGNRKN